MVTEIKTEAACRMGLVGSRREHVLCLHCGVTVGCTQLSRLTRLCTELMCILPHVEVASRRVVTMTPSVYV